METYLAEEEISPERIKAALRQATLDIKVTPVLCGSSFKNKGVQPLLDAVIDYLPSPLDVPAADRHRAGQGPGGGPRGARPASDDAPLPRSPSGDGPTPTSASSPTSASTPARSRRARRILNAKHRRTERIGRILEMHANHREEREEITRATSSPESGLKQTSTGDTLCDPSAPIKLETIEFPSP
jgi:elongation factor G